LIPAGPAYLACEAQAIGATPVTRATFFPYPWPNGVSAAGDFVQCAFVSPDRIQAHYHGFTGGYWISPALTANLQVPTSPAVISWQWNCPGFNLLLYYRGGDDPSALAAAAWTLVNQGGTIQIYSYYQFKLTLMGYRAWAENALSDAGDFTAYAVGSAGDPCDSYASEAHVPGDPRTFIEALQPRGEYAVVRDIVEAGSVSMEAPKAFDNLVAGAHSGLRLHNGQRNFVDGFWVPAPLFSANKSSFFLAGQNWHENLMVKIELGWFKGGWFKNEFGADPWLAPSYSDFITLFLGRVTKWGPVTRTADAPQTAEVYAADAIMDCLQKRICLPGADGMPAPLTYGEFLCPAEAVSGWSPAPVVKSAAFAQPNYNELDTVVASGGGAFSLIAPGITAPQAFQCQTSGANHKAYGVLGLSHAAGDLFATGTLTILEAPAAPLDQNLVLFEILDAGTSKLTVSVDSTGALLATLSGPDPSVSKQCDFNIQAYVGVPLNFGVLLSPEKPGYVKIFVNNDEVLDLKHYMAYHFWVHPLKFHFGTQVTAAETWKIAFENVQVQAKYYLNAFRVTGGPFASLGPVYIDFRAQPDAKAYTKNSITYEQRLERFPEYGLVQFSTYIAPGGAWDEEFEISGDVLVRVVENAGGRHALAIITDLLDRAGLTPYVDAAALAAAYLAVPDDIINARFAGGAVESRGLKDYASLGLTVAEALKEICSRCLYWIFVDAGKIKIVPYTAAPLVTPTDPRQILTASNKWENNQVIDLENINAFVTVIYGWYDRNPNLHYVAGSQEAGGQGTGLDFSWAGPVACENRLVAVAKAELLWKFLSPQERLDPVTTTLAGARLEIMTDVVSLEDELLSDAPVNYLITGKEVGLDQGNRMTTLQLIRFLGA